MTKILRVDGEFLKEIGMVLQQDHIWDQTSELHSMVKIYQCKTIIPFDPVWALW